ncbi:MAG: HlyD family efflux transporter periplasmic adaptor subunit [Minisyncoccia bacterium]
MNQTLTDQVYGQATNQLIRKILAYARAHKVISAIVLVVVLYLGYTGYKSLTSTAGETRYVLSVVEKGAMVTSITGSGQVSSFNQLDLKPKASGDVVYVGVVNGQQVKAGTLVAQLDATDAQKSVRDAQVNLDSTKLSLEKILRPADTLSLIQTENALAQASSSILKAYDDGFNSVSNAFLDLPVIMAGTEDILHSTTVDRVQENIYAYTDLVKSYDDNAITYRDDVATKYQTARDMYDKTFAEYRSATRSSSHAEIENYIANAYMTSKDIADSVKSISDLLGYIKDKLTEHNKSIPAILTTHQNLLATYISKTNSALIDLLGIQTTITTSKYTIAEKTESLRKLKAGADAIDIQSTQLSLKQRENALLDAQANLAHYFVRAPFAGTIAKLNVKKGDPISTATSVATLITKQKIAEISLNEVDVAKVKVGQKATLTFDAIDGLTIAGDVAEIDTIGTVSQGVVTYTVTITLETQDDRVKSGMSVSAAIITNMKQDVLMVPNSAVKAQGGTHYVELFDTPMVAVSTSTSGTNAGVPSTIPPRQQAVEIGLSNDTMTEIVSGLKGGDQVVSRTIVGTGTKAAQAPSIFSAAGVRTPGANTRTTTGR